MPRINWNEPRFNEDSIKEVSEVIDTAYVNEGPKTKEFESLIKEYLGVKYVILTTSASAALFLAIKTDAIIKGVKDFEVIIPDMTMIATATSVGWAGGKPISVDVEKDRMSIDVDKIEEKIGPKTIAIVPVQVIGRACNMDKIKEIANKYNLTIIEDAAGALGSKSGEKYLGTVGKVGCFSLQSNKIVTSGQGGIIVTDDEKYYEVMRRLRDFGRISNKEFLHEMEGYNLKFNDLSAALGLSQFKIIEDKKTLLLEQHKQYIEELSDVKEIKFPEFREGEIPLWIDVVVEKRDELIEYLKSFDIYARPCWPPIHRNKPYEYGGKDENFQNSSFISDNVMWLPNGPAIDSLQISLISKKIIEFYGTKKDI